jgi:hypothetical protein
VAHGDLILPQLALRVWQRVSQQVDARVDERLAG